MVKSFVFSCYIINSYFTLLYLISANLGLILYNTDNYKSTKIFFKASSSHSSSSIWWSIVEFLLVDADERFSIDFDFDRLLSSSMTFLSSSFTAGSTLVDFVVSSGFCFFSSSFEFEFEFLVAATLLLFGVESALLRANWWRLCGKTASIESSLRRMSEFLASRPIVFFDVLLATGETAGFDLLLLLFTFSLLLITVVKKCVRKIRNII